jgi:hypothetical protein
MEKVILEVVHLPDALTSEDSDGVMLAQLP